MKNITWIKTEGRKTAMMGIVESESEKFYTVIVTGTERISDKKEIGKKYLVGKNSNYELI